MVTKKDRRHDGWIYPNSTLRCPRQYIIDNCLEPTPYWDDWKEYRDGFRDNIKDWKKIKKAPLHYYSLKGSGLCSDGFPDDNQRIIDRLTGHKRFICYCHYRYNTNSKQTKLLLIRKAMGNRFIFS